MQGPKVCALAKESRKERMEWNRMEWKRMEWNGMERGSGKERKERPSLGRSTRKLLRRRTSANVRASCLQLGEGVREMVTPQPPCLPTPGRRFQEICLREELLQLLSASFQTHRAGISGPPAQPACLKSGKLAFMYEHHAVENRQELLQTPSESFRPVMRALLCGWGNSPLPS